VRLSGKFTLLNQTSVVYKEYERISNSSVNGDKIIEEVEQKLGLSQEKILKLVELTK